MMKQKLIKYLNLAIGIEKRGIKFYSDSLKKVNDKNSKGLLNFLIKQEKMHLDYFKDILDEVKKGQNIHVSMKKKMKNPVFDKKAYKKISSKKAIDIFNTALDIELKSISLYTKFADEVKEKSLKRFLKKIASYEKQHFNLIKTHEDSIYNFLYWQAIEQPRLET